MNISNFMKTEVNSSIFPTPRERYHYLLNPRIAMFCATMKVGHTRMKNALFGSLNRKSAQERGAEFVARTPVCSGGCQWLYPFSGMI